MYIPSIKEKYLDFFKNSKLDVLYNECLYRNRMILKFLDVLIETFNQKFPNYFIEDNITRNCQWNFTKFSLCEDSTVDKDLLNYFSYFYVIKNPSGVPELTLKHFFPFKNSNITCYDMIDNERIIASSSQNSISSFLIYNIKNFDRPIKFGSSKFSFKSLCYNKSKIISIASQSISIYSPSKNTFTLEKTISYEEYPKQGIFYILPLTKNRFATTDIDLNPDYDYEGVGPMFTNIFIWSSDAPYERKLLSTRQTENNHSMIQVGEKICFMERGIKILDLRTFQVVLIVEREIYQILQTVSEKIIANYGTLILDEETFEVISEKKSMGMFGAIIFKRLKHNIVFGINDEFIFFYDINSNTVNTKKNIDFKDVYKIIEGNDNTFVTFGKNGVK